MCAVRDGGGVRVAFERQCPHDNARTHAWTYVAASLPSCVRMLFSLHASFASAIRIVAQALRNERVWGGGRSNQGGLIARTGRNRRPPPRSRTTTTTTTMMRASSRGKGVALALLMAAGLALCRCDDMIPISDRPLFYGDGLSYFELRLYWPPTWGCRGGNGTATMGTCAGNANERLELLTLAPYDAFNDAFNTYCGAFRACAILAGLRFPDQANASSCLLSEETRATLDGELARHAPAWVADGRPTLGDRAWMQHGSCASESLNETAWVSAAVSLATTVASGPAHSIVRAGSAPLSSLLAAFPNATAQFACNPACELEQMRVMLRLRDWGGTEEPDVARAFERVSYLTHAPYPMPPGLMDMSCQRCRRVVIPAGGVGDVGREGGEGGGQAAGGGEGPGGATQDTMPDGIPWVLRSTIIARMAAGR